MSKKTKSSSVVATVTKDVTPETVIVETEKKSTEIIPSSNIDVLQTTNFFGYSLTVYGTIEEPVFKALEVATMLEHSNITAMLNLVDEAEKGVKKLLTPGGNQDTWFLTEDGLYEVLMRSTKPIAKDFKRAIKGLLKEIRLERHKALLTTAEANSELIAKLERDLGSANLEIAMLSKTVATAREEYKTLSAKLQRQEKWSYELSEEKKRLEEANNLIRFRLKCITDENNGVYAFIEKNGAEKAQKYLANFPSLNIGA